MFPQWNKTSSNGFVCGWNPIYPLHFRKKYAPDSSMYFICWMAVGLCWGENNHNGQSKTCNNSQASSERISTRIRRASLARSSPLHSQIGCVSSGLIWLEHLLTHDFTLYVSHQTTRLCHMPQPWKGKLTSSPSGGISASASGMSKEIHSSYVISNS